MTISREALRKLDHLAHGDDDELAEWARDQYEHEVLKIPMALKVDVEASAAISPSGTIPEQAIVEMERRHRYSRYGLEAVEQYREEFGKPSLD
jgi:hypothetical protein